MAPPLYYHERGFVHTLLTIHVAVADMDATYGADVAVEIHTNNNDISNENECLIEIVVVLVLLISIQIVRIAILIVIVILIAIRQCETYYRALAGGM